MRNGQTHNHNGNVYHIFYIPCRNQKNMKDFNNMISLLRDKREREKERGREEGDY